MTNSEQTIYNYSKPASSARALKKSFPNKEKKMNKYIFCIHDKKSETLDGFVVLNNVNEGLRMFEEACEKNPVINKWPEDFAFILVSQISYTNGEIDAKGQKTNEAKLDQVKTHFNIIAEAKDFVKTQAQKNEKNPK